MSANLQLVSSTGTRSSEEETLRRLLAALVLATTRLDVESPWAHPVATFTGQLSVDLTQRCLA